MSFFGNEPVAGSSAAPSGKVSGSTFFSNNESSGNPQFGSDPVGGTAFFPATPEDASGIVLYANAAHSGDSGLSVDAGNGDEVYNLLRISGDFGHDIVATEASGGTELQDLLSEAGIFVLPELEGSGNTFPDSALTQSFVAQGGTLVVFTPRSSQASFVNDTFGLELEDSFNGNNYARSDAATSFPDVTLGDPSLTSDVLVGSLAPNSTVLYADGENAAVAVVPFGSGNIVIMGWDFFDAPAQSQDWVDVYGAVIEEFSGDSTVYFPPEPTASEIFFGS